MQNRFDTLLAAVKRLHAAEAASLRAAERRAALPAGSSRARVTSANAAWARAAEERDLALRDFVAAWSAVHG